MDNTDLCNKTNLGWKRVKEWNIYIYIYIQCFDKVTAIQPINGIKESREENRIGNRRHDTNKIW